eukprot:TRINITY_DN4098_c0_g1_i1.p1 TRINITY_DN4098_c0_g1~~TRINITY_DN4098_c0_g1_i1.p1  ORF type:complete len:195 (+),score=28.51 TRINITY_DN4098_c0_g1_i1:3-587(+)
MSFTLPELPHNAFRVVIKLPHKRPAVSNTIEWTESKDQELWNAFASQNVINWEYIAHDLQTTVTECKKRIDFIYKQKFQSFGGKQESTQITPTPKNTIISDDEFRDLVIKYSYDWATLATQLNTDSQSLQIRFIDLKKKGEWPVETVKTLNYPSLRASNPLRRSEGSEHISSDDDSLNRSDLESAFLEQDNQDD